MELLLFDVEAVPDNNKIRPVIKWTGGKYDEYSKFQQYIPDYASYYEPFFGGGGVFFAMRPGNKSFLNDKSSDLARFYSQINEPAFKKELLHYADAWEMAGRFAHSIIAYLANAFKDYVSNVISYEQMKEIVHTAIDHVNKDNFSPLFDEDFVIDSSTFIVKLKASLVDKFKRIRSICAKEERIFNSSELEEHIETGVKSGLYLYLRGLTNKISLGTLQVSKPKATANWYFVREFCYASMFRYNRNKEFNIPYGGIAYNRKNFRLKADNIFAPSVQRLFKQATFYNLDFQDFLLQTKPGTKDFIFLDPPYDSEFSEYDQNAFTRDDQVRLRDTLMNTKAMWMMVIKQTEFITSLYTLPGIKLIEFDKTYTYNVRGRNNRDTKHLIIINYEP